MDPMGISGVILALLLRTFLFQPFTIASGAMLPTLDVNDYVVTTKLSYGYSQFSLPFGSHLPAFQLMNTPPKRGDVILFALPRDPSTVYVKRVIGLAGDRVQIINGIPHVNGKPLKRERIEDFSDKSGEYSSIPQYEETLPDGTRYRVIELTPSGEGDNTKVFVVPPGHCFVMGDNSVDSRYTVGYLPYANIFAKASFVVDYSGKRLRTHPVK